MLSGPDNIGRGNKIRLPQTEVNNVTTLRPQRLGSGRDGKRFRGFQATAEL
jgi:hypothetical protein